MNMVKSLVWRKLRKLERFHLIDSAKALPPMPEGLDHDQALLGFYENPPHFKTSHLIVTTTAVWCLYRGKVQRRIRYQEMRDVEMGNDGKLSRHIVVRTNEGGTIVIECGGGEGRTRDSLALLTFLHRVL